MTDELRRKLSALRAVAPKLNEATTDASNVVAAVEFFLDDLSIGVSAEVCFRSGTVEVGGDGDDSQTDDEHYLAYGRVGGKFRLHVVEKHARTEDRFRGGGDWSRAVVNETPWSSCPRETKLESFAVLPDLLARIADAANRLTEKAGETSEIVRDVLAAMSSDDPEFVTTPVLTVADAHLALYKAIDATVRAYKGSGRLSDEVANNAVADLLRERAQDPSAAWGVAVGGGELAEARYGGRSYTPDEWAAREAPPTPDPAKAPIKPTPTLPRRRKP